MPILSGGVSSIRPDIESEISFMFVISPGKLLANDRIHIDEALKEAS
jgi:hypothetical protein